MPQEGQPSSIESEGLHCTQGHFVPYFGPATWLWIGGAKFCMQCVVERVVPFLDAMGVGRVVKCKVEDRGDGVSLLPPPAHPPKYPRH